MTTVTWIILSALTAIIAAFLIIGYVRLEKPLSAISTSGVQGLCALGLLNAIAGLTGTSLGFGWLSIGVGFFLEFPA